MTDTPQANEFLNHIFDLVGELMEVEVRIAQLQGRKRQIFDHGSQELLELAERIQENNSRHLRLQREI
ncbi:hypothetical protein BCON_0002g00200 [Botryotinia convoluta]|uniref:Uncharacterized protein n=1 Tax=Botryotinia convoluta TaxID=54673 RepID=A0A4Z1IVE5_9HELO|nr:hypothetical protein BCON_0002g00200 [Botryotinia convoluta]